MLVISPSKGHGIPHGVSVCNLQKSMAMQSVQKEAKKMYLWCDKWHVASSGRSYPFFARKKALGMVKECFGKGKGFIVVKNELFSDL